MRTDLGVTKHFPLIFETSVFNPLCWDRPPGTAFTVGTGGREKHHLHPADERSHRIVLMIDQLMLVECECVSGCPVLSLQRASPEEFSTAASAIEADSSLFA
jgi:hypothetical protein